MGLDMRIDDGKAKADTVAGTGHRIGALPERLRDVLDQLRRDADALIRDREDDLPVFVDRRPNHHQRSFGREFHGVCQQVLEDLVEHLRVGAQGRQRIGEVAFN